MAGRREKLMPSFYIGVSLGAPSPIFFNLHASIPSSNIGGGAPVTIITGGTGSGKTYCGLNLTAQAAILGYTIVVIDYKGDFAALKMLEDEIGKKVTLWEIRNPEFYGALDPFRITTEVDERIKLINALANLFAGGVDKNEESAIGDIIRDEAQKKSNTLTDVVHALQSASIGSERNKDLARGVGTRMSNIMKVEEARICFARRKRGGKLEDSKSMKVSPGSVTVATLLGLSLPKNASEANDDITTRAASGILYLLTNYISALLANTEDESGRMTPKLLVLDEAWAVLSTKYGADTVKSTALLGRSRNLATLLITQSPNHYANLDIKNTIGTRICFRASEEEAATIVKDVGLPKNEGWEVELSKLESGCCLFAGRGGRNALMEIDVFKDEWRVAFETDPTELLRKKRIMKERQDRKNYLSEDKND